MLAASVVTADEKEVISYEEQIKPIFRQHCVACHACKPLGSVYLRSASIER